jgi:hypothetical protein
MEKSDPQLREDVRRLSAQVRALQEELAAEKAKPARVKIEKHRVVSEVTRDNPAQVKEIAKLKATIAKLQARPADVVEKIVDRVVEVPVTVEKVVKVTEYLDDPKTLAALEKAKATIAKLQSQAVAYASQAKEIDRLRATVSAMQWRGPDVFTKIVHVPVPDPNHAAEIAGLRAEIDILKRGGLQ